MITPEALKSIRVLYRAPESLWLWGIPYEMRPGQSPKDLMRAYTDYVPPKPGWYGPKQISLADWIWLGGPGWGSMTIEDQALVKPFLEAHRELVPGNPYEWTTLP